MTHPHVCDRRKLRVPAFRMLCHRGYTMMEVVVAVAVSSVLVVGLASSLLVAVQVADSQRPASVTIGCARGLDWMASELSRAQRILTINGQACEWISLDHAGQRQRIRYNWDGQPGASLMRSVNGSAGEVVVPDLASFSVQLQTNSTAPLIPRHSFSARQTVAEFDGTPTVTPLIEADHYGAQQIPVARFHADVGTAQAWSIMAVRLRLMRDHDQGTLHLQLRAADSVGQPTGRVLAKAELPAAELSTQLESHTVFFDLPAWALSPSQPLSLVYYVTGDTARVGVEHHSQTVDSLFVSDDAQQTWQASSGRQLNYQLIGVTHHVQATHQQTGQAQTPLQTQTRFVALQLSARQNGGTHVSLAMPLSSSPTVSARRWASTFDTQATSLDDDLNGLADWSYTGPLQPLVSDGVWSSSAQHRLELAEPVPRGELRVDIRCRGTQAIGPGAILQLDADWNSGNHLPLILRVTRVPSGSTQPSDDLQRLSLHVPQPDGTAVWLAIVPDLPNDWLNVRLTVHPDSSQVFLSINGRELAAMTYQPQSQPDTRSVPELFITNEGGTAEFDYIAVQGGEVE